MKTNYLFMATLFLIGLSSCGSKDEIVGKWQTGTTDYSSIVNFTSDKYVINESGNLLDTIGTWIRKENKIYINSIQKGRTVVLNIVAFEDNTMLLQEEIRNGELRSIETFKRVE